MFVTYPKVGYVFNVLKYILLICFSISLIACDDNNQIANQQLRDSLFISEVSPPFGLAGKTITVTSNVPLSDNTTVILSKQEITATIINNNTLLFDVPNGAISGLLQLKDGSKTSNRVLFSVSNNGLLPPNKDKLIKDAVGTEYVADSLVVKLKKGENTLANAQRLAAIISGDVIGQYADLRWWQLSISVNSLDELESWAKTLEADAAVEGVAIDVIMSNDAVDWSQDPDLGEQRDRNRVEEGVALYESRVNASDPDKILPFLMSIGVSESGIDFNLPDFGGYAEEVTRNEKTNITLFSDHELSSRTSHGSNVTGLIAGELKDAGNAGLLSALANVHGGANIRVDSGSNGALGRLASSLEMIKQGATVINWSWGQHYAREERGTQTEDGAKQCNGDLVTNNTIERDDLFRFLQSEINGFFDEIEANYPSVVIVASAGNGATDAGDADTRLPSANDSDQMIVVGAHSSGSTLPDDRSEDVADALDFDNACFDSNGVTLDGIAKRAHYSNYGERVDIAASGSIVGFQNFSNVSAAEGGTGTSFATPIVTATVALMQSINPNLTPAEIKQLLRRSALPIETNKVLIDASAGSSDLVFTRALTTEESQEHAGKGARLNVEGAIQAAIDSLENSNANQGERVDVGIGANDEEITRTIEVAIPVEKVKFDKVDIMFVTDVSSSYDDDIKTFRTKADELAKAFADSGADVQVGVASFSDFPESPYGSDNDYAFRLDQPLSSDLSVLGKAFDALNVLNGKDGPESQLEALFQVSQAATGWRDDATALIFLSTDTSFHDSDVESGYSGAGFTKTLAALNDRKARVFGLQSGNNISDVLRLTQQTNGDAFILSEDSAEIIEAVNRAFSSLGSNLSVTLAASGDFAGVVKSVVPTLNPSAGDGAAIDNVNPGDRISFDVTFTKGLLDDGGSHTFTFRLLVNADDVSVIQEIPIVFAIN